MVSSIWFEIPCVDDPSILKPSGLLDAQSGADLRTSIAALLQETPGDILIDCQGIDFMDSSGFGALVAVLKRVREHGKQLYLCSLNSQVRIVLELTGTEKVFTIFPDQEACLRSVSVDRTA
ncbi:STAS domain-containing protein [Cyanobium sp. Copco_Reservoir_LC18]|jgi:anti-anti-sigma factor|uniref:STAS domain-containing protein n=1 Tax=Cyanobium sp. Copco_Reservoir_LC18 TaxID=1328305 RepID=UPI0019169A04|nr:STAS domain-containing protein [Cyanobium sp. Copco_Reservoir_LC18]